MSRKYRQQGYQDAPSDSSGKRRSQPRGHREGPKSPQMPGVQEVRRCSICGAKLSQSLTDVQVLSKCPKCNAALHSCKHCVFLDPTKRFECSEPITERISPKDAQNKCQYFEFRTTVEKVVTTGSQDPQDVRDAFENLFKK